MTALVAAGLLAAWLVTGAALAVQMRRRGHDLLPWLVPGLVFGPLLIPYARGAAGHERPGPSRAVAGGVAAGGPVDVLVGIDGSPESRAALSAALGLLGPRLGRCTLATVVDYETASPEEELLEDPGWEDARRAVARELAELAARVEGPGGAPRPATVILAGRPARALVDHAERHGYELVVVGRRGRGLARTVLGSVAGDLARDGKVPVLIAGQ